MSPQAQTRREIRIWDLGFKEMYLAFIISVIILVLSIIASLLALFFFIQLLVLKAPYVRTPRRVIDTILKEVNVKQTDTVYDLGCGDASFLIAVDKKIGAKTIGYELSPIAFYRAKQNVSREGVKTKLYFKSFFKQNVLDADIVFCFLVPGLMEKVGAFLEAQLKKGAEVISYAFPIPQWPPTKIIDTLPTKEKGSKIYIYQR